ncbi:hypothetical protein J0H33_04795 [bacterium]|jgi:hypothetical protein|nr:hypothetical protein [bacterium]
MAGIFYDPSHRKLHIVSGAPQPGWTLVTHNCSAGLHHCRRILREWLPPEEAFAADWGRTDRDR